MSKALPANLFFIFCDKLISSLAEMVLIPQIFDDFSIQKRHFKYTVLLHLLQTQYYYFFTDLIQILWENSTIIVN